MTSPLRRRHRVIWIALSLLLPALLTLSLLARHSPRGNPHVRWGELP